MSFWQENKGTFKSAGIATIKGIGHGTKALGKAGYATYKKSEAKRNGTTYQEPQEESSSTTDHASAPAPPVDPNPNLNSFPAPPRRNVGAYDVPEPGMPSHYPTQSLNLVPTQPQGYQQGYQAGMQPQGYQQGYQAGIQPQVQQGYQTVQPQGYQPGVPPGQQIQPGQFQPPAQPGQPGMQSGVQPGIQPGVQPGQPGIQPGIQPGMQPSPQTQPYAQIQPTAQPGFQNQAPKPELPSRESQRSLPQVPGQSQNVIPAAATNAFSQAVAGAVAQTVNQTANQMVQGQANGQPGQGQPVQDTAPNSFQNNLQNLLQNQLQSTLAKQFPGQSQATQTPDPQLVQQPGQVPIGQPQYVQQPPSQYGQPGAGQQAPPQYGQTGQVVSDPQYGRPAIQPMQSAPGLTYGQPAQTPLYGPPGQIQTPQTLQYATPPAPVGYGQPAQTYNEQTYGIPAAQNGQPAQPIGYGQLAQPIGYGQPVPSVSAGGISGTPAQPGYQAPQAQTLQNQAPQLSYANVAAPAPTVPATAASPIHTASPSSSSPSVSTPVSHEYHSKDRAGHYEMDDNGQEKYIPKPPPDASKFAPPPVRRDRVTSPQTSRPSIASSVSSASTVPKLPPALPSRNTAPVIRTVSTTESAPDASNADTSVFPPPLSVPATAPAEPEHKSIKFVDIDITKFGPPPPRIFRGNEPPPKHGRAHAPAHSMPSTSYASAYVEPAQPASETEKKAPPPKPAKPAKPAKPTKPLFDVLPVEASGIDMPSSPPPYESGNEETISASALSEPSVSVGVSMDSAEPRPAPIAPSASTDLQPNFAAQIAKLRSTKISEHEGNLSAPPKPVKRGSLSKPAKPVKPELKMEVPLEFERSQEPVFKLPKPKTRQFAPSEPSDVETPPPMPHRPKPETEHKHVPPKPHKPPKPESRPRESSEVEILPPMPHRPTPEIEHTSVPPKPHKLEHMDHAPPPKPAKLHAAAMKPKPPVPAKHGEHLKPIVNAVKPEVAPLEARTPPPPPPSRGAKSESKENTPPPPPPARNYHRPAAPLVKAETSPPQLDLELLSGWFANTNSPLLLPKALLGLNYSSSYLYSSRNTSMGNFSDHTREIDVTLKDLSKVTYKIHWRNNDPSTATSEVAKFAPSPISNKPLLKQELVTSSQQFGEHVAAWCLHHEGEQVGSGECWDLAHDALLKGCGKHAFVSTYHHHGYPILELQGSPSGSSIVRGPEDEIRRGDILQFTRAKLEDKSTGSTQSAGDPDHTSVVVDKVGDRILVAEQNVQGIRKVCRGEYVLSHIVGGSVVVYRPVSAQWAE